MSHNINKQFFQLWWRTSNLTKKDLVLGANVQLVIVLAHWNSFSQFSPSPIMAVNAHALLLQLVS